MSHVAQVRQSGPRSHSHPHPHPHRTPYTSPLTLILILTLTLALALALALTLTLTFTLTLTLTLTLTPSHHELNGAGETFGAAALMVGDPRRQYGMLAVERTLMLVISLENFPGTCSGPQAQH